MSRMSFLEWAGLFIVLFLLFDVYQNGSNSWIEKFNKQDKAAVSPKPSQ